MRVVKHDDRHFYTDSETDEDSTAENGAAADDIVQLDEDHELLLKSCIPLLQSRNSGVSILVLLNGNDWYKRIDKRKVH